MVFATYRNEGVDISRANRGYFDAAVDKGEYTPRDLKILQTLGYKIRPADEKEFMAKLGPGYDGPASLTERHLVRTLPSMNLNVIVSWSNAGNVKIRELFDQLKEDSK